MLADRNDGHYGAAPAVQADGLKMTFGKVVALESLSLEVPQAMVFGLLGPNGAGKTTLVRILSTLLRPSGGRARVLGYDVVERPLSVRRSIGLAGQFAALDEELTGRENLEMVGRLYRLPAKEAVRRATDVLARFDLLEAAGRRVRTYSGGMRRRLDLGASLVGQPRVLLLDEPTTGLDPASRQALWAIVDDLRSEGTTVLLTTQYLEEADRLAQRIAVVDHGRIVAEGTTADLKAAVGREVLLVRVADQLRTQEAAGLLSRLDAHQRPQVDVAAAEVRLAVDDPDASVWALRALDGAKLAVAAIELHQPSLDDVFMTLTGADGAGGGSGGEDPAGALPTPVPEGV
jgi:daunorubicin resistance ABC transporter ATP-binding subunit